MIMSRRLPLEVVQVRQRPIRISRRAVHGRSLLLAERVMKWWLYKAGAAAAAAVLVEILRVVVVVATMKWNCLVVRSARRLQLRLARAAELT